MTKALTEADGPSWRDKLPPIPTVSLEVRQKLSQQTGSSAEVNGAGQTDRRTDRPGERFRLRPAVFLFPLVVGSVSNRRSFRNPSRHVHV